MGLKDNIAKTFNSIVDSQKVKHAFSNDKRIANFFVARGNRNKREGIFLADSLTIYVLEDKNTSINDIIITERNKKLKVKDIKNATINLMIDEERSVDAIAFECVEFDDPLSYFNHIEVKNETNTTVVINIENMNDSQISDFANTISKIDFKQNLEDKWGKIRYDLMNRYEYEKYEKYVSMVDETIATKKSKIKWETAENIFKIAGAFIGEILRSFTNALLDKYGN